MKVSNLFVQQDNNTLLLPKSMIREFGYNTTGYYSLLVEKWLSLEQPEEFLYRKEEIQEEIPSLTFFIQKQSLEKLKEFGYVSFRFGQGNCIYYKINTEIEF